MQYLTQLTLVWIRRSKRVEGDGKMGYDDLVLLIHVPKKKLEARSDIVEMQHCRKQLIQISKQSHFRFYHESGELSKRRHNDKRACPKLFALLPFFFKEATRRHSVSHQILHSKVEATCCYMVRV